MLLVCVLGVPLLTVLAGCSSAVHLVRETPDGGEITIPTNTNTWPSYYRSRAAFVMSQKCPGGFLVDREGAAGGPSADPAVRPGHESYFGYTGGSEAEQVYHIIFHAVPPTGAPAKPGKDTSPSRPSSSPAREDKDELPPPRPVSAPRDGENADRATSPH
jgi:hypothetical protein